VCRVHLQFFVNDGVTHCIPHANNFNICASVPLKDRENRDRDTEDRAPVSICLPLQRFSLYLNVHNIMGPHLYICQKKAQCTLN